MKIEQAFTIEVGLSMPDGYADLGDRFQSEIRLAIQREVDAAWLRATGLRVTHKTMELHRAVVFFRGLPPPTLLTGWKDIPK